MLGKDPLRAGASGEVFIVEWERGNRSIILRIDTVNCQALANQH
jgi:hypothetical protein